MKINVNNSRIAMTVGTHKQFPRDMRPQVALSGRSNVGKSSLINTLLGRKNLARVSSAPGKTITINYYDIDGKMFLVDLPGYGYAKRSMESKRAWSSLTEDYFLKNQMFIEKNYKKSKNFFLLFVYFYNLFRFHYNENNSIPNLECLLVS